MLRNRDVTTPGVSVRAIVGAKDMDDIITEPGSTQQYWIDYARFCSIWKPTLARVSQFHRAAQIAIEHSIKRKSDKYLAEANHHASVRSPRQRSAEADWNSGGDLFS